MIKPIYIVVTPFFPMEGYNYGSYCYDFVKALEKTGLYDVKVFVPNRGTDDYIYQGVKVYTFTTKELPSGLFPFLFAKLNQCAFLKKVHAIGINMKNVAVCHGHTAAFGIYPLAIQKLNPHCKTLLHHHDLASFGLALGRLGKFWINRFVTYFSLKRIHEAIDCHVFISAAVEKSFRLAPHTDWTIYKVYRKVGRGVSFLPPAKIKRVILLHNGVDIKQFNPVGRLPHKEFVMGSISNFWDLKDHHSLMEALRILRDKLGDWKLKVIWREPIVSQYKAYVKKYGLEKNIVFEKEVDHTELPGFYRSLDLFVLPSYFEGYGCVYPEAWSCGAPFIACEGQGMDDLILPKERNLWLCKPKNPKDLADKILYYYHHRPEQHLASPVAIDELVSKFVEDLK